MEARLLSKSLEFDGFKMEIVRVSQFPKNPLMLRLRIQFTITFSGSIVLDFVIFVN